MSINIKMNRHDMCVSVQLTNSDEYEVNPTGFLSTLEDFLSRLDLYENVDIEIKRKYTDPCQSDLNFDNNNLNLGSWVNTDTITVSTSDNLEGVVSFEPQNRG